MTRIYFTSRRVINVVEDIKHINDRMANPAKHTIHLTQTNGRAVEVQVHNIDYLEDRS